MLDALAASVAAPPAPSGGDAPLIQAPAHRVASSRRVCQLLDSIGARQLFGRWDDERQLLCVPTQETRQSLEAHASKVLPRLGMHHTTGVSQTIVAACLSLSTGFFTRSSGETDLSLACSTFGYEGHNRSTLANACMGRLRELDLILQQESEVQLKLAEMRRGTFKQQEDAGGCGPVPEQEEDAEPSCSAPAPEPPPLEGRETRATKLQRAKHGRRTRLDHARASGTLQRGEIYEVHHPSEGSVRLTLLPPETEGVYSLLLCGPAGGQSCTAVPHKAVPAWLQAAQPSRPAPEWTATMRKEAEAAWRHAEEQADGADAMGGEGEEDGETGEDGCDGEDDGVFHRPSWRPEQPLSTANLMSRLPHNVPMDAEQVGQSKGAGSVERWRLTKLWEIVREAEDVADDAIIVVQLGNLFGKARKAAGERFRAWRATSTRAQREACPLHRHLAAQPKMGHAAVMACSDALPGLDEALPSSLLDLILRSVPTLRPTAGELVSQAARRGLFVCTPTSHRLVNLSTQRYLSTESLLLLLGRSNLNSRASLYLRALRPSQAARLLGQSEHVGLLRRLLAQRIALLEEAGRLLPTTPLRVVLHGAGIASELEAAGQKLRVRHLRGPHPPAGAVVPPQALELEGRQYVVVAATEAATNRAAITFLQSVYGLRKGELGGRRRTAQLLCVFDPDCGYAEQLLAADLPGAR